MAQWSIPTTQVPIKGMPFEHESVRHSVGEYVSGMAHTNGIESFWSMLKRAHKGTYHKISRSTYSAMLTNFPGVTASVSGAHWTKCNQSLQGWRGSG